MQASEQFKNDLFRQFHGKVLGYLRNKLCNTQLAEDLCSEVFIKVYEKLDSFDESKASLSTWIFTITRNRLTDYYRTRRVFEEVPETMPDGSSVEDEVCNREMTAKLADVLSSMDERERDIIILRYYSGKTLKEIAETMGISYAYVKVLQNKAFAALRMGLGPGYED